MTKPTLRSHLAKTDEVMAKLKAIRAVPALLAIYDREAGNIDVRLKRNTSIVVFRALQKGNSDAWIVRESEGMFDA